MLQRQVVDFREVNEMLESGLVDRRYRGHFLALFQYLSKTELETAPESFKLDLVG